MSVWNLTELRRGALGEMRRSEWVSAGAAERIREKAERDRGLEVLVVRRRLWISTDDRRARIDLDSVEAAIVEWNDVVLEFG